MQKDFLTITPDSGGGSQEVTVQAGANTGNARSTTITISGGGITRTVTVNQRKMETVYLNSIFVNGTPGLIVMNPQPPFFIQKGESILGRFTLVSSGFIRIKMNFLSPTKIIRGEAGDGSVTDINVSDDGLSVDFVCEIASGGSSSIAFFVDDGTSTPWFQMKITYA